MKVNEGQCQSLEELRGLIMDLSNTVHDNNTTLTQTIGSLGEQQMRIQQQQDQTGTQIQNMINHNNEFQAKLNMDHEAMKRRLDEMGGKLQLANYQPAVVPAPR